MNPLLIAKIAGVALVLLGAFWGGKRIEEAKWLERETKIQAEAAEMVAKERARADQLSAEFDVERTRLNNLNKKFAKELQNEINSDRSYDCPIHDGGVRIILDQVRETDSTR